MFFSNDTLIQKIEYRINLLRARGEQMNQHLINALVREKRNLEGKRKE